MFEVVINLTFKTKSRERAAFIVKQFYRTRKQIAKLNITSGSNISTSIRPIPKG